MKKECVLLRKKTQRLVETADKKNLSAVRLQSSTVDAVHSPIQLQHVSVLFEAITL